MATAKVIAHLDRVCYNYDAVFFEGAAFGSLVAHAAEFKVGETVLYVKRRRYAWRNKWYEGTVVRPSEVGLEVQVGEEYPDDFVI